MGDAIDKLLADDAAGFDIETIASEDLRKLDFALPPKSLFKYFPAGRSAFFRAPSLRFTQRTALNDPFELAKRWKEFASEPFRMALREKATAALLKLLTQKGILLQVLKQESAKRGMFLSPEQVAEASLKLLSPQGNAWIGETRNNLLEALDQNISTILNAMTVASEAAFDELAQKWGIFSLSESATSRSMWSLYASSGRGFLVEFDTSHQFFCAANGRCLVWPVLYRDLPNASFIENPAALFLTKHSDFSFEKEWRMIKPLEECDEVISLDGTDMHMCRVLPGMIRSITFGYNYDTNTLPHEGAAITAGFDPNIRLRLIRPDRVAGDFVIDELS